MLCSSKKSVRNAQDPCHHLLCHRGLLCNVAKGDSAIRRNQTRDFEVSNSLHARKVVVPAMTVNQVQWLEFLQALRQLSAIHACSLDGSIPFRLLRQISEL